ncbi:DUF1697 domain-containing protein [Aestuariimicrobium sp. T2.26MG-19.2B]|uniref:DUF1697 domain-containing protein n=1 Tax=Aestuariimicrobium sp. T2.26MG-19.2B TaxID=3040679 RepID=UPI002477A55D|nr:DUF1697 domain-containing protein [Aestuariimicrobium sp. T2.26MG-19.2B]CAI9411174.1 hypothetical protein AESSP_02595 [Aestuariimicrobium sp. T2.26MG-19.2B]
MGVWIALLRAVNVGGRKYPMAELRAALEAAGFAGVQTHIQTGNVRLESPLRSREKLEDALESVFLTDRGFEVSTIVLSTAELGGIVADVDDLAATFTPKVGSYVSVMKRQPSAAVAREIEQMSTTGERLVVRGRAIHLLVDVPFNQVRTNFAKIERISGPSTNRNDRVLRALAAKWG